VNRNYTTDGLNRYDRVGPVNLEVQFLYDANGNLTSDGTHAYSYDIENRLVGAPGNLILAYDPLGRLVPDHPLPLRWRRARCRI
jgi:hypothetical protein